MKVATELLQGHSPGSLAQLTGVSESTARRWLQGADAPEPVHRLLRIVVERDIGHLADAWRGWRMSSDGTLVSPEQWTYTPGELRLLTIKRGELLKAEQQEYQRPRPPPPPGSQMDWVRGRWTAPPLEQTAPVDYSAPYRSVYVAHERALRNHPDPYWKPRRINL